MGCNSGRVLLQLLRPPDHAVADEAVSARRRTHLPHVPCTLVCCDFADVCAGVDAACLNADIAADAAGSACRPLEDGAACGSEQQCVLGVCTGNGVAAWVAHGTRTPRHAT